MNLEEVDLQSSNPADHLGDYRPEHGDPYPATTEAWARTVEPAPADTATLPADAMEDLSAYTAAPYKRGVGTRVVAAAEWAPGGLVLANGVQGYPLIERDPYRRSVRISNHADGPIYIAPTSTRVTGIGSLMIPGRDAGGAVHAIELFTTAAVYVFTLSTFIAGPEPVHVQYCAERYA